MTWMFVYNFCLFICNKEYVLHFNFGTCQKPKHIANDVIVNITSSQHRCKRTFLSLTFGMKAIAVNWQRLNLSSSRALNMARALSPAYVRLGGVAADVIHFDPHGQHSVPVVSQGQTQWQSQKKYDQNLTLSGERWRDVTRFFENAGWNVIFDFNVFKRKNNRWDPRNAKLLLDYSTANNISVSAFQLGNEPNSYKHKHNKTIDPSVLVSDFASLRNLLNKYPRFKSSGLYGPDVTQLYTHPSARTYLEEFICPGGCNIMDHITFHHYYKNGRTANLKDFLDAKVMDTLEANFVMAKSIMKLCSCTRPISLSETSSCYGGGAPGLSSRFAAGFLWLDKLGVSALHGVSQVFRQTFIGSSYSLISSRLEPNPDFYLSVIFKRLVEGPVLRVVRKPENMRVYANCASNELYRQGAVVVYFINLRNSSTALSLSQFTDLTADVYLLTFGDSEGLTSRSVKLNGKLLSMTGSNLPPFLPRKVQGNIRIEHQSLGFIVVSDAKAAICIKSKKQKSEN
ncbi:hypothetical protein Btru_041187 [Bulinus truncatus]|nr:hypothetical protein Btru_041187 [Bulinus truncatus]